MPTWQTTPTQVRQSYILALTCLYAADRAPARAYAARTGRTGRAALALAAAGVSGGLAGRLQLRKLYLSGMDLIAIQEALGRAWVATTMRYVHVHRAHVEQAWLAAQERAERRLEGLV